MDLNNPLVIFLIWGNTGHMRKTQGPAAQATAVLVDNIYRLMDLHHMTRNQLADAAGIDDTSFYRKLDKKPHTFTVEDQIAIASVFETTVSELWAA